MKADRIGSRVVLSIAALFIVTAVAASAVAFPEPFTLPLLASESLSGHGAVVYRLTVPEGAGVEIFSMAKQQDATIEGDGIWVFDAAGDIVAGFVSTATQDGDLEVHLELPVVGVVRDVRPEAPSGFGGGIGLGLYGLPAGQYRIVAGTVSDGTLVEGVVSLSATAGSTLLDAATALGGFAVREASFTGTTAVVGASGVRPLVMLDASLSKDVAGRLYGWFGSFDAVSRLTVEGPGGSSTSGWQVFSGTPAGNYVFTVDLHAGGPYGSLWLWGLDIDA